MTETHLCVVNINLILSRYQFAILHVYFRLQFAHTVPEAQRMLLTTKTAQHLEVHLHSIAQLLAALCLHADRYLLGQLHFGLVAFAFAYHLRGDYAKIGFGWVRLEIVLRML